MCVCLNASVYLQGCAVSDLLRVHLTETVVHTEPKQLEFLPTL